MILYLKKVPLKKPFDNISFTLILIYEDIITILFLKFDH